MISCQFALYPLRVEDENGVVAAALDELAAGSVELVVGRMSSEIHGEEEQVFTALRVAFDRAAQMGEVVMIVTLSNAC